MATHRSPLTLKLCLSLALGIATPSLSLAADTNTLLLNWLNAQTNIQSWSADVLQTRNLKSLVQPLTATGHVWFTAPNLFRWELGNPPQTIAVRQPDRMLVIYPRLKRVESYPLTNGTGGAWRDALALLEAGFPRSLQELQSRFRLLSIESTVATHQIVLQPLALSARRLMPRIRIFLDPDGTALLGTELEFADGSFMRNDFTNTTLNPSLEPHLFDPPLDPVWQIVHPNAAP
jgi:outer membrane lipoprotein-sorting protein